MADSVPKAPRIRRRIWIAIPLFLVVALAVWLSFFADFRRRTILVDGVMREYLLYSPSSGSQELKPLVVAYHGFSGTAASMAEQSRLHELLDKNDFYLAYIQGDPTWQLFVPENAEVSPDVAFFDRMCEELIGRYPIDPSRVYVVGMSRGGDFAVYLAAQRSTRIAAVVSQAACVSEPVAAERPFPLMIIVGTKDDGVPADRFPSVPQAFRDRGHTVNVLRPKNVGHSWHVPHNEDVWRFLASHKLETSAPQVISSGP